MQPGASINRSGPEKLAGASADDDALTKPGIVRSLYDPTAGTGGMLSVAEDHLSGQNPDARLVMYGD